MKKKNYLEIITLLKEIIVIKQLKPIEIKNNLRLTNINFNFFNNNLTNSNNSPCK